ncbi:caprin-1a isoform X2 [Pseudochaenichthys georgianus]|uniref:caprin-1a isoform X2 n=1 Tax=Pseudochaenichthys georgianus TaxID=52239 RepID=UPI001469CA10|nr:caprin-1a isoform X2 [Pseudochaenichthys georgianus]
MPSAMVGNNAVQSASPDLGNGSNNEAMKQILAVIDKKVRNMEKKKSKLDDVQARKSKGEQLNQDQLEALAKYQEIAHNLEFARELQKNFIALGQDIQKAVKKTARREQLQREEMEQQRLKTVLELQFLLDQLGDESVRQDLKRPDASGSPLLSDADLTSLDEFYKVVGPDRNYDIRLTEQYEEASVHLFELLDGRDKAVAGTTYKSLKDTLDKVLLSGYFDRAQPHQNGRCEEEEEQEEQTVVDDSNAVKQPSEPEAELATEKYAEIIPVETTEFVNRQFIPETTYSSTDDDQVEKWAEEAQMVNSLQHQPPAQLAAEPTDAEDHGSPPPAADPVVRKQVVQDLMAQLQGTYNFMQESILEFDGQALDPAIVAAQPMKPAQTVDMQQMGCPPAHSESRLPQISAVSGPQETSQVFNLNAPIPPATEGQAEPLKQPAQFPGGYGQGFNVQSESAVVQPDIPQETLQSVVGGFQPQEQVMPSAGGHEESAPGAGFGQSGQSFYNSRGVPRGGPRNGRGMINGYRGSSNGFRGGYEGYRAPFSNAPSTGYSQTQFNAPRDYSNNTYQREGYQQNYKRGAAQGPRGLSRGNATALRS